MTPHDLIVQRPPTPSLLVLLLRGVGSSARDLAPLGEALAAQLPDAAIVSLQAPEAVGPGRQWFSVQAVTETDRPVDQHWLAPHPGLCACKQTLALAADSMQARPWPLSGAVIASQRLANSTRNSNLQ